MTVSQIGPSPHGLDSSNPDAGFLSFRNSHKEVKRLTYSPAFPELVFTFQKALFECFSSASVSMV